MTGSRRTIIALIAGLVLGTLIPARAQQAELLFRASFDRLTAFADFAQGSPESTLTNSLELRAQPGVIGHALILEDDEICAYEVRDNLRMDAATVSFWVKPVNWTGADRRYEMFFRVAQQGFVLYVDKNDGEDVVRLYCAFGRRGDPDFRQYFVLGKTNWDADTWHRIDATWDATHLALYVDGKFANRTELPDVQMPDLLDARFYLVPTTTDNPPSHSSADRTCIDEFEIYGGIRTAEQILASYIAQHSALAGDVPPPLVTAPRAARISIDGRLDEPAWASAARVPILSEVKSSFPHRQQAAAAVCWDDHNLYLGLTSQRQPGALKADADARDGRVWEDDAFEVFLSPGEEPREDFVHLIINSAGALFDSTGPDPSFDADLQIATGWDDASWTAEVAVPFAELGVAAPLPGEVWRANFCRDWPQAPPAKPIYTAWAHIGGGFGDHPERFGRLTFGATAEGARIALTPTLSTGALEVTADARAAKLDVSVSAERATIFEDSRDLDGPVTVRTSLREIRSGVLAVTVTGADGEVLADYRTRFLVREPIAVSYLPRVLDGVLGLGIDLRNLEDDWAAAVAAGGASLRVDVVGPGGYATALTRDVDGLQLDAEMPLEYRDGTYAFTYTLSAPGMAAPLITTGTLEKPPTPWLGANAGVSDEVLEPWTALQYPADNTVGCWNREYRFDGPFPSAIVAGGQDLLRAPASLTLRTADGAGTLHETSREAGRRDPHRAEFAGEGRFGDLAVPVRWESWMEYDGLSWATVTIEPPADGLRIEELTLHIPLRPDLARYIRGERRSPNRSDWDGALFESHFEPYIWVHNDDEGLCFAIESEANWVAAEGRPVVRVIGGDDAAIELRIIGAPVEVTGPISWSLGLQATPIKPLVEGWRARNFGTYTIVPGATEHVYMEAHARQSGLFAPGRPEETLAFVNERRAQGIRTFFYAATSCTPNNNPTYDLFSNLWYSSYAPQFGPYDGSRNAPRWREATPDYYIMPACNGERTLADLLTWQAQELLKLVGPEGLYTDCDGLVACENRLHDHGFTDAFGKSGVTWPILEHRDLLKRLATVVRHARSGDQRAYYMTHNHSQLLVPVHGFADFFYPGEQYTHRLFNNRWFYIDDLDPTAWRAEMSSYPSGVAHVFLPEFVRGSKDPTDDDTPVYSESLLAMCAVSDVNCSGAYMNNDAMAQWWAVHEATGIVDARFVGYWREDCPVAALTDRALASVYLRPDGAAVLAIANRLPDAAEVQVRIDFAALGLDPATATATDARTGATLTIADGVLTVPIAGRNYTYVTVAGR